MYASRLRISHSQSHWSWLLPKVELHAPGPTFNPFGFGMMTGGIVHFAQYFCRITVRFQFFRPIPESRPVKAFEVIPRLCNIITSARKLKIFFIMNSNKLEIIIFKKVNAPRLLSMEHTEANRNKSFQMSFRSLVVFQY